jgi:gas vesicle structural protein
VPVAIATNGTASNYLQRAPSPSGLAEVLDVILDKGLVIDAYVRVSVIGIEVITIDARIVVASVDTYLRFAEAVNRLDLTETQLSGLPELREVAAKEVTKQKIDEVQEKVTPESPKVRGALKGVAAGAVAAGAAAAAKTIADRVRSGDNEEPNDEEEQ